jgi:alginate O-acetyltransferase complex protein AlgI
VVFSSLLFLFWFLPAFLTGYYLLPRRWRNLWAVAASLVFYAWGEPRFVYVLVLATAVDYGISRKIALTEEQPRRRRWLQLSLVLNVGLLLYCKYANFFVDQLDAVLAASGRPPVAWTRILLPLGVSFFTFHKISYVADVYWRRVEPARSFAECLLYIVLFPQLIAGPIIRYHDVAEQIRSREHRASVFWRGVQRFARGLAKKALIADVVGEVADTIYAVPVSLMSVQHAWLAAFAYYFQIYFDFSGYSDMAIGMGRMIGIRFRENFDRPYTATTFTGFWRRWHISLSNFMREYLYVPLGGNRVGRLRGYVNLWIVFLVSGFWHGASWSFVVWGAYQGVFLTLDRLGWSRLSERLPQLLLRLSMVLLVTIGWVLFRAGDLGLAWQLLQRMFLGGGPKAADSLLGLKLTIDARVVTVFVLAAVISFLPWSERYLRWEHRFLAWTRTPAGRPVMALLVWTLLVLACCAVANSTHTPFIYYRF